MLKDLLADISTDVGYSIGTPAQKNLAIIRVNQCAKELFENEDLVGSLREQVFDLNTNTQQVSLPYYVGDLRGMRYYDARLKISLNDMQPRYHYGLGNETWLLKYRLIGKRPLHTFIENESILTFVSALPAVEAFTVSVSGRTTNSNSITETLDFAVGDVTHSTTGNFVAVTSINKNVKTTYDVAVQDAEGNEISKLCNTELSASYVIVQVMDSEGANANSVDCLYKTKFIPFADDYDSFPCGDMYDKAIYWKFIEHEAARKGDKNGALAAMMKCNTVCKQISDNQETGIEKPIGLGINPYIDMGMAVIPLSRIRHGVNRVW